MTQPVEAPGPVDPAAHLQAAHLARETYTESLAAIRADERISDLERAERIAQAHGQFGHALDYLAADLTAARRTRLAHVEQQLPIGPQIPDDTSQADRTVLLAAFRGHQEQARTADVETLAQRLTDAVAFGDSIAEKAIVTHLLATPGHAGHQELVRQWADTVAARGGPDHRPVLVERRDLRTRLDGTELSAEAEAESRAFSRRMRPAPPPELADLDRLRYEAAQRQQAQRLGVTVPVPRPGDTRRPARIHRPGGPYSRPVRALGE